MGSLTKRPTIPKQVQPATSIQYVAAPTVDTTTDSVPTESESSSEARKESLLRRTRGRLGTVFTGFRGLLSEASPAENTGRKTLLGE